VRVVILVSDPLSSDERQATVAVLTAVALPASQVSRQ
jgi:hypothetical protein